MCTYVHIAQDSTCVIWETRMGKQMQTLTHHKHQVPCMNVNKEIATKKM